MKRHVSGPVSALLSIADVTPDNVYDALEDLVWGKTSAILRNNHPLVQRIRQTTAINVVQISRRSRYLLVEIEQHGDGGPSWQYRERNPRQCTFSCRGQLPAAIEMALQGALLEQLVIPALAMGGTLIEQVDDTGDGWLNVDVVPPWHVF